MPFSCWVSRKGGLAGISTAIRSTTLTAPSLARWLSAERNAAARAFLGIEYE